MIDTLISDIKRESVDQVAVQLVQLFEEWKLNNSTAADLERTVERHIGNSWVDNDQEHKTIYSLWLRFKENEISNINGMTMNERLYSFGLFERFEKTNSEIERLNIYTKLHAKP